MKPNRKIAIVAKECVACGTCVHYCPREAISVFRGMYAKVSEERCIGCGLCAKACPAGIISIEVVEDSR